MSTPEAAGDVTPAGELIVVSGPPGAGKSTISALLAEHFDPSVLVAGDEFFGFLCTGRIEPWLPESDRQNTTVIAAAAASCGQFVQGGYTVVYDGVVGPWSSSTSSTEPAWGDSTTSSSCPGRTSASIVSEPGTPIPLPMWTPHATCTASSPGRGSPPGT